MDKIDKGMLAPDFEAESTKGKIKLSEYRGRKVILYFFPKAFTPGCIRETQNFGKLYEEVKKNNAEIIGISVDSIDTQKRFAEKLGVSFPLVSDKNKTISKLYNVLNSNLTSAQRTTFIINERGYIVEILRDLKSAEEHVEKAIEIIKSLY